MEGAASWLNTKVAKHGVDALLGGAKLTCSLRFLTRK
jgi:hypothetical protein